MPEGHAMVQNRVGQAGTPETGAAPPFTAFASSSDSSRTVSLFKSRFSSPIPEVFLVVTVRFSPRRCNHPEFAGRALPQRTPEEWKNVTGRGPGAAFQSFPPSA